MTATKTSAWTDEERASMVRQRHLDTVDAYETGPEGKPLRVKWRAPPICETRIGKPDDLAFVIDCWVKREIRDDGTRTLSATKHHVRRLLGVLVSMHELPRLIPRLIVAHVPGEEDAILGWAAIEPGTPGCVHYIYVRSAARRQGVARELVGSTDVRIEYSHLAPKGVTVPSTWTFNPNRVFR